MTNIKLILYLIVCFYAHVLSAQEPNSYPFKYDSTLYEDIQFVSSIEEIDDYELFFGTVMVFISEDFQAKGFIVINFDYESFKRDSIVDMPLCSDEIVDTRLIIEDLKDSTFLVKYKWRNSVDFITDTCYVYQCRGSLMTYPTRIFENSIDLATRSAWMWYMGPASTDERDSVYACMSESEIKMFFE